MKKLTLLSLLALAGCSATRTEAALSTQPGQLFCAIATGGGDTIVAGLINAAAAGAGPAAGAGAVIATGAASSVVQADCAQAAANIGAKAGVPVSPPATPAAAPQIAVTPAG
jgi:hypothetical protein